jgi:hypothetical protein
MDELSRRGVAICVAAAVVALLIGWAGGPSRVNSEVDVRPCPKYGPECFEVVP